MVQILPSDPIYLPGVVSSVNPMNNEEWLRRRDVETPCSRCRGLGCVWYASTATWRGGLGGASMTQGVCDHCWGSGDEHRHWTDLRKLRAEEDHRVAKRAAELLENRLGVGLRILEPALRELCAELDKFERQRRPRPYGFDTVSNCLAKVIREMLDAKSPKDPEIPGADKSV